MSHQNQNPAVLQRDIHFDLSAVDISNWHPHGRLVTQVFNGMSLFFPKGEQFFIDSVRHYRSQLTDPVQRQDVKGFIAQEAMHGREHKTLNKTLANAGYDADLLEARAIKQLDDARSRPPLEQLAATIALEHLTAILADIVLRDDRLLAGAPAVMQSMWRWHAVEETEHKAVAFGVYKTVAPRTLGSYILRCRALIEATARLVYITNQTVKHLRRQDKTPIAMSEFSQLRRFLFTTPGIVRRITLPFLAFFRPGFHPWQHNNRDLLNRWAGDYQTSIVAQVERAPLTAV